MSPEAPKFGKTPETVEMLFDEYAQSAPFNAESTRSAYLADFRKLLDFAQETGATKIDETVIQNHLDSLPGKLSLRSHAAIQNFFGWIVAEGKIHPDKNPMKSVIRGKDENKSYQNITVLSKEKVQELLKEAEHHPRDLALITIALNTGAKMSEIQALTKHDIVKKSHRKMQIIIRKDDHERKFILSSEGSKIISDYKESLQSNATFLFHSRHKLDEPITRAGVARIMHDYGKTIGNPNLTLSTLRYTYTVNSKFQDSQELAHNLGLRPYIAQSLFKAMQDTGYIQTPHTPEP